MAKKKREKRAVPLPEAIDGRRWQVHQSPTPRMSGMRHEGLVAHEGVMFVPMGTEQAERLVRLHEMVHVKITPPEVQVLSRELPESIVQLCEDARVHGQMKRLGFEIEEMVGVISDMEMKQIAEHDAPSKLAATAAAVYGTGEWARLYNALSEGDEERTNIAQYGAMLAHARMSAETQSELPSFRVTLQTARDIVDLLGDPNDPDPPPALIPSEMLQHFALMPMELTDGEGEMMEEGEGDPQKKGGTDDVHGDLWANMTLEEPPLPLRLPGKMRGKKRRIADVKGRRLHRVGRLIHDGKVFGHRPPLRGGGAVLIDTSGSMDLSIDQVLALCVKFPAGVIGAYSSDHGDTEGTLRVIARKGRRVEDHLIDPPGGGNGVDGPALDWLAKQSGPRFWISDAGVSGGMAGLRYCLNVCRKHGITRVDDAWEIVGKAPY